MGPRILFGIACTIAIINCAFAVYYFGKSTTTPAPVSAPAPAPAPAIVGEQWRPLRVYQIADNSQPDLVVYCVAGYEWIAARDGSVQPHFNPFDRAIECGGKK